MAIPAQGQPDLVHANHAAQAAAQAAAEAQHNHAIHPPLDPLSAQVGNEALHNSQQLNNHNLPPVAQNHQAQQIAPNQPVNVPQVMGANPNTPKGRSILSKFAKAMTIKKVQGYALIALGIALPIVAVATTIALAGSPAGPAAVIAGIFLIPMSFLLGAALFSLGSDVLDREKIKDHKKEIHHLRHQDPTGTNQAIQERIAKLKEKNHKLKDRIAGRESANTPPPGLPGAGNQLPGLPGPGPGQANLPPRLTRQEHDEQFALANQKFNEAVTAQDSTAIAEALADLSRLNNTQVDDTLVMTPEQKWNALIDAQRELNQAATPDEKKQVLDRMDKINRSVPPAPPPPPPGVLAQMPAGAGAIPAHNLPPQPPRRANVNRRPIPPIPAYAPPPAPGAVVPPQHAQAQPVAHQPGRPPHIGPLPRPPRRAGPEDQNLAEEPRPGPPLDINNPVAAPIPPAVPLRDKRAVPPVNRGAPQPTVAHQNNPAQPNVQNPQRPSRSRQEVWEEREEVFKKAEERIRQNQGNPPQ